MWDALLSLIVHPFKSCDTSPLLKISNHSPSESETADGLFMISLIVREKLRASQPTPSAPIFEPFSPEPIAGELAIKEKLPFSKSQKYGLTFIRLELLALRLGNETPP